MPEGFSWTISGATILAVAGWLLTVGMFLYKRGGLEEKVQSRLEIAHKKLDELSSNHSTLAHDRQIWRDQVERDLEHKIESLVQTTDARISALVASDRLLSEQLSETRENLAKNYMVRSEINDIEKRVAGTQERIEKRIDRIDERLTNMQTAILAAIKEARG